MNIATGFDNPYFNLKDGIIFEQGGFYHFRLDKRQLRAAGADSDLFGRIKHNPNQRIKKP